MKRLPLSLACVFALASVADAADLAPAWKAPPPLPPPSWAGFYIGVDGGAASLEAVTNDINIGPSNTLRGIGGLAGGYAGYNFQDRSFVYGVEADINWVGPSANATFNAGNETISGSTTQSQSADWVATFRGRAGIDVDSTLLYLTGGLAVGEVKGSWSFFCPVNPANCTGILAGGTPGQFLDGASFNTTQVGWTAGVGFEHMFGPHWTFRGEVRYVDLGNHSVACVGAPNLTPNFICPPGIASGFAVGPSVTQFSTSLVTGTVGVGYKF